MVNSLPSRWQHTGGGEAGSLYAVEHTDLLEEAGLIDLVADPGSHKKRELTFASPKRGGKSSVYEINGTGVVVKKHYPTFWSPELRKFWRNPDSTIMANLGLNVGFERALARSPDYTTPKYLGHLMLGDEQGTTRHYTLMTRLDIVDGAPHEPDNPDSFSELLANVKRRCSLLLLAQGIHPLQVKWDELDANIATVEENGNQIIGIFDQETYNGAYPTAPEGGLADPRFDLDPLIGNL